MSGLSVSQYVTSDDIRERIDTSLRAAVTGVELPDWNLPVDHLSPSSFDMARRCPYQWQQRYILGRKERPGEAPVMGTTVHAALERNFGQKILTHTDLKLTDLLEWYLDKGFSQVVADEQEKAGEEILWDTPPDIVEGKVTKTPAEKVRNRGYQIIAGYHDLVAPRIQPIAVETKVEVDWDLPVPIIGRFDLEREASTIDYKTGKQTTKKPKESWRIQAAVYGEATGKPVEFHSLSASPKSNAVTIVTPLEEEALLVNPSLAERTEMRRTLRAIASELCMYMTLFGPDEPWPTHGRFHQWACDYCGFRGGCPAWKES